MSKVLGRIKGVFNKKKPSPQRLTPPGAFPNAARTGQAPAGTITKPPDPTDDDDEDIQSLRNYNVQEETRLKEQQRGNLPNENPYGNGSTPSPGLLNPSNTPSRGASSGFVPGLPMNNNSMNSSPNANTGPTSDPSARVGLPSIPQIQDSSSQQPLNPIPTPRNNPSQSFGGFPPGTNKNQSAPPPPSNSQPSFGGFPPGMNPNQSGLSPPTNSQSSFGGFPPGMNSNQSSGPQPTNPQSSFRGFPPGMNPNQSSGPQLTNPQSSVGGFPPGMNPNQSGPSPPTNSQSSFGGFPPGMNPNQSPGPRPTNPQSSFSGFPPGMNPNQSGPSQPTNAQSPFRGFPPGMNLNQTQPPAKSQHSRAGFLPGMNQHSSHSNHFSPTHGSDNDDNVSRLELDYPIENVLIDANIPSAIAIKVNEAIERDRSGRAHHINRYTFETSSQQISFGHYQQNERHSGENSHHGGMRHIREIHNKHHNPLLDDIDYPRRSNKQHRRRRHKSEASLERYVDKLLHTPGSIVIQAQNSNDISQILSRNHLNTPMTPAPSSTIPFHFNTHMTTAPSSTVPFHDNTGDFPAPVFYYTARALPHDPMHHY